MTSKFARRKTGILLTKSIRNIVHDLFHLQEDTDEQGSIESIKRGVEFRGGNLWALVCAIFLASIGLNTNSTAVIIGAMLISPLMGPIVGIGLALGINDWDLVKRAGRNLFITVLISLSTSTLYFMLTPLAEAQSELLARITPTIFDVFIAFFGGCAGIVALTRKEKSNVLPGVAIATALMPPLCTAGYGVATGQLTFFIGAFYLFFINSVFICMSTLIFVRYLGFHRVEFIDKTKEKKARFYLLVFSIVAILPSIYIGTEVVRETWFRKSAHKFIADFFDANDTKVIATQMVYSMTEPRIEVTLFGKSMASEQIASIKKKLKSYGLENATLVVNQPSSGLQEITKEFQHLNQTLKTELLTDLYKKNQEALAEKENQIHHLEQELKRLQSSNLMTKQLARELAIQYPEIEMIGYQKIPRILIKNQTQDIIPTVFIRWKKPPPTVVNNQLLQFLKIRLNEPKLQILFY